MSSCITAIGTANPKHRIKQSSILQFMVRACGLDDNNAARLERIYNHSGIDYRYSVIPDFGEDDFINNSFFAKNASESESRVSVTLHSIRRTGRLSRVIKKSASR